MGEKKARKPAKELPRLIFLPSLRLLLHGTSICPAKNAGNVNGNSTDSIMEKFLRPAASLPRVRIHYSPLLPRLSRAELYICCFSGEKFAETNPYWMAFIQNRTISAIFQKNFGKIV